MIISFVKYQVSPVVVAGNFYTYPQELILSCIHFSQGQSDYGTSHLPDHFVETYNVDTFKTLLAT